MRPAYLALIGLACGTGCSKPIGPELHLSVANKLPRQGEAGDCKVRTFSSIPQATSVRITARVRGTMPGQIVDLCDAVFPASALSQPNSVAGFKFPAGSSVDLYAEVFNETQGTVSRLATGALFGVSTLDPKSPLDLRLVETEGFRCLPAGGGSTPARLAQSRAFHTATQLPNGQVLVVGGVIPALSGDGPTTGANAHFITGTAEVFDPASNSFIPISETKPQPRAFHHAMLLPDDPTGAYRVLVVGGISPLQEGMPALRDNIALSDGFRLDPNMATVGSAEILTYDARGRTIKRAPTGNALHSAAFSAGAALPCDADRPTGCGAVVGGGVTGALATPTYEKSIDSTRDGMAIDTAMIDSRYGGALVAFSDKVALLVGGQDSAMQKPFYRVNLAGKLAATEAEASDGMGFPMLRFATVTPLDRSGVMGARALISGGLAKPEGLPALNPPSANGGLWLLKYGDAGPITTTKVLPGTGYKFDPACNEPLRFRPVAFSAAIRLPSEDRVLVTGGTPRYEVNVCNDCDGDEKALSCALSQSSVYTLADNTLAPTPEPMQVPRFGHTQSLLPNGTVLVAGGLTRRGGQTYGVRDAEIWNPARRTPPMGVDVSGSFIEADDPVRDDLKNLGRSRRPGKPAYANGDVTEKPARECDKARR